MFRIRPLFALLAIVAALSVAAVDADARSFGSSGSRGSRTFSSPAPTATAPKAAAPIQRTTTTQPSQSGSGFGGASRPGLFGGGLMGGLAAGFIGAGLFGLLFGHGLFGGMGGFASMLGLLLQIGLVVIVGRLVWNWFLQRQPAYASGAAQRQGLSGDGRPASGFGGFGFGGGSSAPLEVKPEDFTAFEQLLGDVQTAYGAEDINALRAHVTPEMLSYFSEEFSHNASRRVVNQIANIKLLQGDLSEAWREGDDEYATVAMRYSLDDRMVDRTSGKVLEQEPSEATELWTFRRAGGGHWILSAIQQT